MAGDSDEVERRRRGDWEFGRELVSLPVEGDIFENSKNLLDVFGDIFKRSGEVDEKVFPV